MNDDKDDNMVTVSFNTYHGPFMYTMRLHYREDEIFLEAGECQKKKKKKKRKKRRNMRYGIGR